MDEEMFVGEQRFASKDIHTFIDYYRIDDGNHAKFGKLQQYVKGMKGTLDANVPLVQEEDPDAEENRKLEKKMKKGSEESDEEEEEQQPKQEKAKEAGSDEESEDESESESEESEEEDEQPDLFKGGVFGQVSQPNHQTFAVEFGKMNTVRSLQASTVQINASPNKSQFGKTAFSIEKVDESRDSGFGNKSRESPFLSKKAGFGNDISQSDDGDTHLMKHKSDIKNKSGEMFGEWSGLHNELEGKNSKDNAPWKPLETSVLSSGSVRSAQSKRPLMRRQEASMGESRINIADASMISQKVVEKSNVNNNNTMRSDKHNLFNKSKLANASTMRLEYDDDEEDTSKYRL